jgi:hypothetical protein
VPCATRFSAERTAEHQRNMVSTRPCETMCETKVSQPIVHARLGSSRCTGWWASTLQSSKSPPLTPPPLAFLSAFITRASFPVFVFIVFVNLSCVGRCRRIHNLTCSRGCFFFVGVSGVGGGPFAPRIYTPSTATPPPPHTHTPTQPLHSTPLIDAALLCWATTL